MFNRRSFNKILSALLVSPLMSCQSNPKDNASHKPLVLSTWNNKEANLIAYQILKENPSSILDAIEKAVNSVESNPLDVSVGYGGSPDSSGNVTLDACIMDHNGNAGSVCFLKDIKNAVSVARKVMENSPHVMLCGQGAKEFALLNGFTVFDLLTPQSKNKFLKWKEKAVFEPEINSERHDTIGLLAINSLSNLSGACSTSGLSYKLPGRVGDSPIIGSGLYVDNEVGASTATGYGELVMQSCSSFLIVELMRSGMTPMIACKEAIKRISLRTDIENKQVGLLALDKLGQVGAFALRRGFNYTVADINGLQTLESEYFL